MEVVLVSILGVTFISCAAIGGVYLVAQKNLCAIALAFLSILLGVAFAIKLSNLIGGNFCV